MVNIVTFTNGSTYNDGSSGPGHLSAGGARNNLVPMLADTVIEVARAVEASSEAADHAAEAAASAAAAASVVANALATSSNTTASVGGGVKEFITVDNLDTAAAFVDGMWVKCMDKLDNAQYMTGIVLSASGNTLRLNISSYAATDGSSNSWSIFATGAPGVNGYIPGGPDVSVGDGGTGRSSHTPYAVLCGGATSTGAQQSTGVGTVRQVLTSNGPGVLPSMQDAVGYTVITASTALTLPNVNSVLALTHATVPIVVTIPLNATTAFPIGSTIALLRLGAAECSVSAEAGVTILKPAGMGLSIIDQYTFVALIKVATDSWVMAGNA